MWIVGSTLSISQRSLLPEGSHSPVQVEAQKHATELIQTYSSRAAVQKALRFLRETLSLEIISEEQHVRVGRPPHNDMMTLIPSPYGLKGGAAREALVAALAIRKPREPRDVDLVRRGYHATAQDSEVARRFMARDYRHGARVELVGALGDYLTSRDLTINEVVTFDNAIFATLICLLDTVGHTIRPSRYRGGSLHRRPQLLGQSLLKMIRLYAEGHEYGEAWSLTGIPEEVSFSEFDLAINLNKAFQRGRPVAERFLKTAELLALIPTMADPVRWALEELAHLRHGEKGLFPDVSADEWVMLSNKERRE